MADATPTDDSDLTKRAREVLENSEIRRAALLFLTPGQYTPARGPELEGSIQLLDAAGVIGVGFKVTDLGREVERLISEDSHEQG